MNNTELKPVYVHDPHSNEPVNIAPFLYVMHSFYTDYQEAEQEFAEIIEDIASHISDDMLINELRMQTHFYNLAIIRRLFAAMQTGEMPRLP